MGLFFKKKKKNDDGQVFGPSKFESADSSDDSFLVSAVSDGGISDDMFETPDEVIDKTRRYGANSGLAYVNKYSATNQKLATTKVVDVGAFKKPVKEEPKTEPPKPAMSEKSPLDLKNKDDDVLFEPIADGDDGDDSDFDSFFDEFMKKTSEKKLQEKKTEPIKEETVKIEPIKAQESKPVAKPAVKRKKKRAIDIDIISGGSGGDII